MALITLSHPQLYPSHPAFTIGANPALTNDITVDAAGEYHAVVFVANRAMTISHVGFLCTASGSPTADVRIETVDSSGNPSGTLWAANTNAVSGTLSTGWNLIALTASASIAAGDVFVVKIVYNSGTSVITRNNNNSARSNLPYKVTNVSGSAVKSSPNVMGLALGSSSTTFYCMSACVAFTAVNSNAFNNSVAGAKRGLRFQVAHKARMIGAQQWLSSGIGNFNVRLASDAGAELDGSEKSYDGDLTAASTGGTHIVYFDNPVILTPGTWYRLEFEPTSATNINLGTYTMPSADYLPTFGWAVGTAHYFTFTTAGGYIDTATDQIPICQPMFDQIEDGTPAVRAYVIGE